MGLWPFGRGKEPKEVEFVSRVVTATSRDGARLRGKLTLHFKSPQTQRDAEEAMDRGASEAVQQLAATESHQALLGDGGGRAVEDLVSHIHDGLSADVPDLRALDIAAIHVVGDLSTTASRTIGRGGAGVTPVGTPIPVVESTSASGIAPSSPTPNPSPRRPTSSQMLAVTADRLVAPGSEPTEAGRSIAPLARDTSVRLLIGILRAYDVLVVRKLVLDEESDLMSNLVPTSDAPLGQFEQSRADELARWIGILGQDAISSLRRESSIVASYLLYSALLQIGVGLGATVQIIEAASAAAFPADRSPLVDMSRYLHSAEGTRQELGAQVIKIIGSTPELEALDEALNPLVSTLTDDLGLAAAQVHNSLKRPPDQAMR